MPVQQYGEPPKHGGQVQEFKPDEIDYSRELNEIDRWTRCDHRDCTAQAYIKGIKRDKALYFCRHHGHMHVPALLGQQFAVQDETFKLNKR